jgi:RNA polymerase sigma-70 factor (ECF subfamily)
MPTPGQTDTGATGGDAELTAALRGDAAARWNALEACRDYLRLLVRRGGWSNNASLPQTSDLVQNTFLDAWRGFSRFQGQTPGHLRAWLKAILIHLSLNARRRRTELQLDSGLMAGGVASTTIPSPTLDEHDDNEAVEAALERLSSRQREVIHLRIWDQWSFAQIGGRLDISEDAARMLYGRALGRLRELMRAGHDPE